MGGEQGGEEGRDKTPNMLQVGTVPPISNNCPPEEKIVNAKLRFLAWKFSKFVGGKQLIIIQ
jgi:hypothetical protein